MKRLAIILLLCLIGCNISIPITDEARDRPSIGSYWMYEVGLHWTEDLSLWKGTYDFHKYGFPFKLYSLEELDPILDDWSGWCIEYDRNLRNCRWFANSLRDYARLWLPSIAVGIIHFDYKAQLYGHAAGIFVECDTTDKDWYGHEENYTTYILNFKHSPDFKCVIDWTYESFNMDRWQIRFIDM